MWKSDIDQTITEHEQADSFEIGSHDGLSLSEIRIRGRQNLRFVARDYGIFLEDLKDLSLTKDELIGDGIIWMIDAKVYITDIVVHVLEFDPDRKNALISSHNGPRSSIWLLRPTPMGRFKIVECLSYDIGKSQDGGICEQWVWA